MPNMKDIAMKQEFDSNGNHRLVAPDGRATHWANYTACTKLDGMIGVTDYYTGMGERIVTPQEFIELIGVGEKKDY